MRRRLAPSEVGRLVAPLLALIDAAWRRMHWWIAVMAVLYAASGITIVKPDEVALVLRWGRLVGTAAALEEHGPGLLFALPRPIDEVVRVKVKRVSELRVDASRRPRDGVATRPSIRSRRATPSPGTATSSGSR